MSKTIVFASPKGGVGKTTSCLLLAQVLAGAGRIVSIVDADKRHRCDKWINDAQGNRYPAIPPRIEVENAGDDDVQEKIESAASRANYVLVDLQGAADLTAYQGIQMADFVVVPSKASDMDIEEAGAIIKLIFRHEKAMQKLGHKDYRLPFGVLFTQTNAAVRSRTTKFIKASLVEARVPMFETELHERDAFRAFYSFHTPLGLLSEKDAPNLQKAIENAERFAQELLDAMSRKKDLMPPEIDTGAKE